MISPKVLVHGSRRGVPNSVVVATFFAVIQGSCESDKGGGLGRQVPYTSVSRVCPFMIFAI